MKNTTNTTELSEGLKKAIALKQFNNEDFFIFEDKVYEGTEDEERENYEDGDNFGVEFSEWIIENVQEVEPIEGDEERDGYMVLTDDEADEKWAESLDSYLEECIYPELTGNLKNYFDDEKWKQDARYDGRGHSLSTYDGHENEESVDGETFYIYRIN